MITALGSIRPLGPAATALIATIVTAVCVLAVVGYYGQKLQWWLQDRRKAKEESSAMSTKTSTTDEYDEEGPGR